MAPRTDSNSVRSYDRRNFLCTLDNCVTRIGEGEEASHLDACTLVYAAGMPWVKYDSHVMVGI